LLNLRVVKHPRGFKSHHLRRIYSYIGAMHLRMNLLSIQSRCRHLSRRMSEQAPNKMRPEIHMGGLVEKRLPAPFDPRYIFYDEGAQEVFSQAQEFAGPQIGWQWSSGAFDGTPILGYFAGGVLKPSDVLSVLRMHGDYFMQVVDRERNEIEAALNGEEVEVLSLVQLAAITAANCAYYRGFRQRIHAMELRTQMEGVMRVGKMNLVTSPTDVVEQFQYPNSVPLPSGSADIISEFQSSAGIVSESTNLQVDIACVGGDPLVRSAVGFLNHHHQTVATQYMVELKRYMNLLGARQW